MQPARKRRVKHTSSRHIRNGEQRTESGKVSVDMGIFVLFRRIEIIPIPILITRSVFVVKTKKAKTYNPRSREDMNNVSRRERWSSIRLGKKLYRKDIDLSFSSIIFHILNFSYTLRDEFQCID